MLDKKCHKNIEDTLSQSILLIQLAEAFYFNLEIFFYIFLNSLGQVICRVIYYTIL